MREGKRVEGLAAVRRSTARIVEASLGGDRVGRIAMLPEEARARPDTRWIRLRKLRRWRDRGPGP